MTDDRAGRARRVGWWAVAALAAVCGGVTAGCGGPRGGATKELSGEVTDARSGLAIAGAEVFVGTVPPRRAVTDAAGHFSLRLPAAAQDAQLSVAAQGFVRLARPVDAQAGTTRLALAPATPTVIIPSPLDAGPQDAGHGRQAAGARPRASARVAISPNDYAQYQKNCAIGAVQGVPAISCGVCTGIPSSCCSCAANCPMIGSSCFPVPPPNAGAYMPSGCYCAPSYCASAPPAQSATTCADLTTEVLAAASWVGGSSSDSVPGAQTTSMFNYISNCLVFADDGASASSNADDIAFYVTTFDRYSSTGTRYYGAGDGLPAPMFTAVPDGTLAPLQGVVVVDVSAYQGGRRLEVRPGATCMTLSILPPGNAGFIDPNSTVFSIKDSGAYQRRGTGADASLVWDPNRRALLWPVDHLGLWAIGKQAASSGGCVAGKMLSACDGVTPVPRRGVRVNVMDGAGTRAWSSTTDMRGNYCANAPVNSFWAGLDLQSPQPPVSYFVSASQISETAMCDPLPDGTRDTADCRTCQAGLAAAPADLRLCTLCALTDPLPDPHDPSQFGDSCALPPLRAPLRTAELTTCTFCPAPPNPTAVPATCTLSDGSTQPPGVGNCTPLDTTLGLGPTAAGRPCACRFAGSPCNYATDQCCFVAARDTGVPGFNQGGCRPGAVTLSQGTCGRCTVNQLGALCDPTKDICCNADDPSMLLACFDGTCVPAANDASK